MSKYLVTLSILALTGSFVACGGKSGNGGISTAPLVPNESEAGGAFAGSDVITLSADDPRVKLVSQTDATCTDPKGTGHQIVDSRLVPQMRFERTIKAGLGGEATAKQFSIQSTVLTNTGDSYSRQDDYKIPGSSRTDQVTCNFKNLKIPENQSWLNCLDQDSVNATRAKMQDSLNLNHCYVAGGKYKTIYQGLTMVISGKKINAAKETVEHDGTLTCDNKPVGLGKTIDITIYSLDIPSLVKDSCAPGKIYFFHQKTDNLNHVYENNSEGLTSYLLPSDSPVDAPSISDVPLRSVEPITPEVIPPPPSVSSDVSTTKSITPGLNAKVIPPPPSLSGAQAHRNGLAAPEALPPEPVAALPDFLDPDWLNIDQLIGN